MTPTPEQFLDNALQEYLDAKRDYLEAIVYAAQEGMTQRQIAAIVGKSYAYVQDVLRKAGVTYERRTVIRPPS